MDFSVISDFVIKNWVLFAGLLVIVGPNILSMGSKAIKNLNFDFLKFGNIQTDSTSGLITKDMESLMWLANRAVDLGNDELISELSNVNQKLFNAHCVMRKSANRTG